MIKRILVALDPDTDTPVATRYAAELARRHEAGVTGLAVVDMGSIEAGSRGGGIGSMYLAEQIQKNLTAEARATARELTRTFESAMKEEGVSFSVQVKEGAPFQRIVEDMKFHDLLVVGKKPHFFYSHPREETRTLVRVVRETIAPSLVVGDTYRPIRRVLVAYDGSNPAARTLQSFVHLRPFGTDIQLELLTIHERGKDREAELMLNLAKVYADAHGFDAGITYMSGTDPAKEIMAYASEFEADLIVAGAHSVPKLKQIAFGSNTARLLEECPTALFLNH